MMEVECVYENGVLRPLSKLDLKEGEKVRVEIKESIAERRKEFVRNLKLIEIGRKITKEELKKFEEEKYENIFGH